jgi:predicted nucleotidyltransferase
MPSPYKGPNRYRTFLKAGKIISKKIAALDGVVGILGTGSIGRKFGDKYSDLDLLVYAHSKAVKRLDKLISIGFISYKGLEYDIEMITYEEALKAKSPSDFWNQLRRWDQQNSQILYDSNNRIKNLLAEKLVYPDWEQKKLLRKYQYQVDELLVYFPEMWANRGQLYNIIDSLTQAVHSIVLWIYAKNKAFEPYLPKWPFFHLENGTVPEAKYLDSLVEIYTRPIRSQATAMHVRKKLLKVCNQIGMKFEFNGFTDVHQRTKANWKKIPEKSKEILKW